MATLPELGKSDNIAANHMAQWPLWELAFRSGFLLAAISSSVSLLTWLGMLSGWWPLPGNGLSPIVWHLHEMLFGFAAIAAMGFSLTAVQTWTGLRSLHGTPLILLTLLWLLARVGFWINTPTTLLWATIAQGLWWYCAIFAFSRLLFLSGNRRNYLLVTIFLIMATLNLALLLADVNGFTELALHLGRSMVLMFTLLISIIAGRVIPFFTERGIGLIKIRNFPYIDKLLLLLSTAGIVIFITGYFAALPLSPAPLLISAAVLHFIRLALWFNPGILSRPLLWSLHLAYWLLAMGLLLAGMSFLHTTMPLSAAVHLITIGAMGLMILAMMSRVSLGHTGRPLTPKPRISAAFLLMAIAALTRALLPMLGHTVLAWQISTLLWIAAMLLFLSAYTAILLSPKQTQTKR